MGLGYLDLAGTSVTVTLVDIHNDLEKVAFPFQGGTISFAFAPHDRILAACADGAIYDAPIGSRAPTKWVPDDRLKTLAAGHVAFSNDGNLFAVQSNAGPIAVYRIPAAADNSYQSLTGSALADAACQKLKPLSAIDPDYSRGCAAR